MTPFESKLLEILRKAHICDEKECWEKHQQALQAIKELVAREVIGEDDKTTRIKNSYDNFTEFLQKFVLPLSRNQLRSEQRAKIGVKYGR